MHPWCFFGVFFGIVHNAAQRFSQGAFWDILGVTVRFRALFLGVFQGSFLVQAAVLRWDFGDAPLVLFSFFFLVVNGISKEISYGVVLGCFGGLYGFFCRASPMCYGAI